MRRPRQDQERSRIMSPTLIGVIAFVVMIILIFLRVPIFMAMILCSLGGLLLVASPQMVITQFTTAPFTTAASYTFALLPLFAFMGVLLDKTGIAEGTFSATQKWLGNRRGGLLSTVVVANTIFGACSGNPTAGCVVFSKMALPSLEGDGYDKGNALACIATASSLAALIPPSSSILICCMLTGLSINRGLMCGIGAGLLMTVLLLICIQVIAAVTKKIPPKHAVKYSVKEKLTSLRLLIPIALLFVIIIVGAYAGWFTATVGGAIGAAVVTIYALAIKRIPVKEIFKCAEESIIINCNLFPMLLGGTLFARLVTLTRIPDNLISFISNVHAPLIVVFTLIVIFYYVAGAVMDIMSCMFITVPIVYPVLTAMGLDPYAILIFLVIMINLGSISPPIGMAVFVSSQAVNVDPKEIFKGIWPYCLVNIACAYLVGLVPQIVNFLPNLFS